MMKSVIFVALVLLYTVNARLVKRQEDVESEGKIIFCNFNDRIKYENNYSYCY